MLRSYNLSMKKIILTYDRLYCEAPVFHVYLCTRQNLFCVCSSREIETDGLGTLKKKTVQEITVIKNTVNSLPLRKKLFFLAASLTYIADFAEYFAHLVRFVRVHSISYILPRKEYLKTNSPR